MQQFLVDANVFVAAVKNPEKKVRTLDLILELISNECIPPHPQPLTWLHRCFQVMSLILSPPALEPRGLRSVPAPGGPLHAVLFQALGAAGVL